MACTRQSKKEIRIRVSAQKNVTFVTLLASYRDMNTVGERSQFDAVRKHLELLENFLHTVVSPEDELLREAMHQYEQTLSTDRLPNAA